MSDCQERGSCSTCRPNSHQVQAVRAEPLFLLAGDERGRYSAVPTCPFGGGSRALGLPLTLSLLVLHSHPLFLTLSLLLFPSLALSLSRSLCPYNSTINDPVCQQRQARCAPRGVIQYEMNFNAFAIRGLSTLAPPPPARPVAGDPAAGAINGAAELSSCPLPFLLSSAPFSFLFSLPCSLRKEGIGLSSGTVPTVHPEVASLLPAVSNTAV